MAWYDTKQAAVDPDNPEANEQIPFSEWNAMVTYLQDKIIDKAVDAAAIGNDKVLVYKTATSTFVFEAQSAVGAIDDLTDVTISGVPADNEVLAYNTGTSEFINQTAAEAGLATVAGLAGCLKLDGTAPMTGDLDMGGTNDIVGIRNIVVGATSLYFMDLTGTNNILAMTYSGAAAISMYGTLSMANNLISNVTDPTSAQHASTKNYDDTHLFTKEVVTSFLDGYIPVYRTASGKFEMEAGGGSAGLPVADTTSIVKGSADGTKLLRVEVDGITTGTTRVMTIPDKNITLCDTAEVMLLSGAQAMTSDLNMGGQSLLECPGVSSQDNDWQLTLAAGSSAYSAAIGMYANEYYSAPLRGNIRMFVPNAGGTALLPVLFLNGLTDTPDVDLFCGLNMNDKVIADMKNSAPTALSGTQKDIEIDIGGVAYYFTVYPTKA